MYRFIVTFLILCFPVGILNAQWNNIITNYTSKDYKAGSQNWQIIQHENGWIYFANKMGVLEFNGDKWQLHKLKNNTDVRSILKTDNKIYMSGINEIGYLMPDNTGLLEYKVVFADPYMHLYSGNIWKTHTYDAGIYFCSDQDVIRYRDGEFIRLNCTMKIDCANVIDNSLIIGTPEGVYALAGDNFIRVNKQEFANKRIKSIQKIKDNFIVATASDGLFYLKDQELVHKPTEADDYIKKNELYSIAFSDKYIAVGTVLGGVVLLNHNGEIVKYFNENLGLQNNTVLSLLFDRDGDLWLGLDNGISHISLTGSITELYKTPSYGTGYTSAVYNNNLYVGTNRGLFSVTWPVPNSETPFKLQLVGNVQGQIWSISEINNKLFCCSDKGLFIITDNETYRVPNTLGTWSCKKINAENKIILSSYTGFYVLDLDSFDIRHISGYNESAINFGEDHYGRIWIVGENELIRLTFDNLYTKITDLYRTQMPNPNICRINDTLMLTSNNKTYKINWDNFEVSNKLNVTDSTKIWLKQLNNKIWFLTNNEIGIINDPTAKLRTFHNLSIVNNFEHICPVNDSLVIIANENGFSLWNVALNKEIKLKETQINKVSIAKPNIEIIYRCNFAGNKINPKIPYANNAITFDYINIDYSNSEKLFRYRLNNNPWSDFSSDESIIFSDLAPGSHIFTVQCLSSGNITTDQFGFTILPPWYRTIWAYMSYIVFIILLFVAIFYFDSLRLKQNERKMMLKQHRIIRAKENEFKEAALVKEEEIAKLKNEQLEIEVQHKSLELAGITINIIRKNEILTEIKKDIGKLSNDINNADQAKFNRRILSLISKINDNIEQEDNFRRFEEHFDLVHNNFMKRLSEKYPDLSINERKMCAFIKMELLSKEISPMLNISVRGVETIRYRLRKKFNLSRDENFINFFNRI